MATEVVKTVDPNNNDADYTSLASWEADFGGCTQANYPSMSGDGDLVGADLIAVADCRCSTGDEDSSAVTIDGWTSIDADHYIKIWTDPDQGYRHDGRWNDTKYRLYNSSGFGTHALYIRELYTKIEGLQIGGVNANYCSCVYAGKYEVCDFTLGYCIIKDSNSSGYPQDAHGIDIDNNSSSNVARIYNTIVYGCYGNGIYGEAGTVYCYNCTVHSCNLSNNNYRYGINGAPIIAINTLSYNNGHADFGTLDSSSDYNLSSDGTAPGAHSVTNATVTFVDETNDDFHLDASDTAARDAGTDLSSDPYLAFTDDIDGETRSAPWDIGADEYVSGGGGQTALFETSFNLTASQQAIGHYAASLTSSMGLTGAQTSLVHLLASLTDISSLQGQPSALAHLHGQLSSVTSLQTQTLALRHRLGQLTSEADLQSQTSALAHLRAALSSMTNFQSQASALAHLQAALSSSLDLSTPVEMTAHLKGPLTTTLSLAGTFETVGTATALFTSVLTLGESLETKASLLTSISDTLSLGATPVALASLKASLTTTFNLSSEVASGINASLQATLSLGGSTTALAHFLADLSSALTMEGQSEVTIHYKINLTSSLSLSDQLVATAAYIMTLVDSLGLGSQVQDVTISATGLITIKLSGKSPGITITAGKPGIEVSGRVPETTFE